MVELATLERWYTGNGIVGSNPTLSADSISIVRLDDFETHTPQSRPLESDSNAIWPGTDAENYESDPDIDVADSLPRTSAEPPSPLWNGTGHYR